VTLHHPTTMHDPHGPLYSVVCTDTNPYGTWQTEFLEHTWVRSQMPGELIRLVGTPNGEEPPAHRTARVITTAATNTHPRLTSDYTGLNRLHSLSEWLENERPVGTVLILDCDFAFRAPLDRHALPEHPIGQLWWDVRWDGRWLELAESITSGIGGSLQQVTWPLIIHTSDLRRIIDRWVELTARIRAETNAWDRYWTTTAKRCGISSSTRRGNRPEPTPTRWRSTTAENSSRCSTAMPRCVGSPATADGRHLRSTSPGRREPLGRHPVSSVVRDRPRGDVDTSPAVVLAHGASRADSEASEYPVGIAAVQGA